MPLTDFVRYLNAQLPSPRSTLRSGARFISEGGRVYVHYADLRLESEFAAIIDTASGDLRGHAAHLRVMRKRDGRPLAPETLFALPGGGDELVFLDRLVRTLHTLNYLTYGDRHFSGLLLLTVHPRHVASVCADHGLAFEEILRVCGLLPEQVTLEFEASDIEDSAHWIRAMANYKTRGYGIAVKGLNAAPADLALLEATVPSLVRIETALAGTHAAQRQWIERLHTLGSRLLVDGAAHESARAAAWANGFDYLQRPSSGRPAAVKWSAAA